MKLEGTMSGIPTIKIMYPKSETPCLLAEFK